MVQLNSTAKWGRPELISPRMAVDGVYFTRFDTYETDQELVFCCKMPDVQLVQVDTRVQDGELVIQGKVRSPVEAPDSSAGTKLICFYRSFPICPEIVGEDTSATFNDGVLTVRLPKARVN